MRARIASVGIVTKNRISSLEAVLTGYIENARRFGRKNGFVVVDGSDGGGSRGACLRMLRRLSARRAVEVSYAGPAEKRAFSRALAGMGLPPEIVRFALFGTGAAGCRVGADRNALLLHASGELLFSPDDDVHCRVMPAPGKKEGLAFSAGFNPEEFWFFKNKDAASRELRFHDRDLLALHEEFLGRESAGRRRVLVTSNGLAGDCALVSPRPYLRLRGDSRRRLLATRASYRRALSRQVVRAVTRSTASAGSGFFASAAGLDNRALLAPFMPVFRNEDGLFGITMEKCFSRGLLVQLPWALLHAPPEPRTFRPGEFRRASPGLRVNDVLSLCVAAFEPGVSGGEDGLRALGDHLTALASLAPAEFRAAAAVLMRRSQSLQLLHLDGLMKAYKGAPKYWAADVASLSADLERSLRTPPPAPREFASSRDAAAGWESFRRLVLKFGALARAWPEFVRAAKELRGRGVRLARPVES
jgi:hypothetical protein